MSSETIYIYTLTCPIDNEVRYVGQSNDPYKRFTQHLAMRGGGQSGESTAKNAWVRILRDDFDTIPVLSIINQADNKSEASKLELKTISEYSEKTFLFNISGVATCFSPMKEATFGWLSKKASNEELTYLLKCHEPLWACSREFREIVEKRALVLREQGLDDSAELINFLTTTSKRMEYLLSLWGNAVRFKNGDMYGLANGEEDEDGFRDFYKSQAFWTVYSTITGGSFSDYILFDIIRAISKNKYEYAERALGESLDKLNEIREVIDVAINSVACLSGQFQDVLVSIEGLKENE